jgi:hypothetical protein
MKLRTFIVLTALSFLFGLSGCEQIKNLTGQGEEKKEAAAEGEAATPDPEATKKAEAAQAEAEKAKLEAEAKTAEANALAEKAKAEAEQAKLDAEKAKAEAQEEMGRAEDKAKRQALTKDLAEYTAEALNLKNQVAVAKDAWTKAGDTERTAKLDEVIAELANLETERTIVEGLMVQGKLDEARTKLEVVKAKFPATKQKAEPTLAEKPIDPVQWKGMLDILAEESCLTKRNLPAQEFQAAREALFTKYGIDRIVYEQLRAQYNKNPRQEDQNYLGQKVAEVCAGVDEANAAAAEAAANEGTQDAPVAAGTEDAPAATDTEAAADTEDTEAAATEDTEAEVAAETEAGTGEATDEELAAADAKASEEALAEKKAEEAKKASHAHVNGSFSGKLMVPGKKGSTITLKVTQNKGTGTANIGGVKVKVSGVFKKGQAKLTGKSGQTSINCNARYAAKRLTGNCSGKTNGGAFKNARFTAR